MNKKTSRALVSVLIVGGTLTVLLARSVREDSQFYKHVDEVMNAPDAWYGKKLQLHGFVVDKSISWVPEKLDYRFTVKNGDQTVSASYTGIVPDGFKDGAEVVLTGKLTPAGFVVAPGGVSAKCPSKYEEQKRAGR